MSTMKIKKGDTVKVIAGKDLGTEGKVLSVDVKNHKVLVEGVNKITKHAKPSQANPNGGIVEKEAPIDISNVMLVVKGKTTRVGFKVEDGKVTGPGCADCKAGVIAIFHALKNARKEDLDRLAIAVCYNPDEEISSLSSREWLQQMASKCKRAIVCEPGRATGAFVRSRKGRSVWNVVVHGVAAHAGNNPQDGRSAVLAAAHLTIAITNLQDLEGKGTSVTVGVIEGGTVCNTVPEKCILKIDTRCWNDEDGREIDEGIEALAKQNWGDGITVEAKRVSKSPAMPCTDATKELVEIVNRAAKEEGYDATWVDAGGGSDANRIARVGVPVIDGVAPAGAGFHSEREYLRVDTIENRVRTLARVLQYL